MSLLLTKSKAFVSLLLIFVTVFATFQPAMLYAQESSGVELGEGIGAAATSLGACLGAGAATAGAGSAISLAFSVSVTDFNLQMLQGATVGKDCLLNAIVILLRETLIRKMTSSIVNWINSGFEGSPSFVTNMDQFLLDTADEAFGNYIYNNSNFAHLCSPFQYDIRFALALQYSTTRYRPQCTLSQIVDNVENAIDNLSVEWDWDVYETITTDPSGNIFTSFIAEQKNVSRSIESELQNKRDDVQRGNGFLSFEKCEEVSSKKNSYVVSGFTPDGFTSSVDGELDCEIVTPGAVIGDTLTRQIGLDGERLALADEINEIIGALIGQLAQQAFGGSGGIRGLSQRQGSSQSFLSQYSNDAQQATQEFGNSVSSDIGTSTQGRSDSIISVQNENLETLLSAETQIEKALACYAQKYDTWLDENDDVISASEVNTTPENDRSRATFIVRSEESTGRLPIFDLLRPSDSFQKITEYGLLLDRITEDITSVQADIQLARQSSTDSQDIQSRLDNTTDPNEIQRLYEQYSSSNNTIGSTNLNAALTTQQNINAYTDIAINGEISYSIDGQQRAGGAVADLAYCQRFTQTVRSDPDTGENVE